MAAFKHKNKKQSYYKLHDEYPTWFSDNERGLSKILDIKPYKGTIKEIYCILVLSAPKTRRGYMEMTVTEIDMRKPK